MKTATPHRGVDVGEEVVSSDVAGLERVLPALKVDDIVDACVHVPDAASAKTLAQAKNSSIRPSLSATKEQPLTATVSGEGTQASNQV